MKLQRVVMFMVVAAAALAWACGDEGGTAVETGCQPDGLVQACDLNAVGDGEQKCLNGQWGACGAKSCTPLEVADCTFLAGCAFSGKKQCSDAGVWGDCQAPAETCNNVDDDCDQKIDEDAAGAPLAQACFCGTAQGASTCQLGVFSACSAGTPESMEICDNKDNDCDNQVDEGCDNDGDDYCASNFTVEGTPTVCPKGAGDCDDASQAANPGAAEQCNGKDDNCNGTADDGLGKVSCGAGECLHEVESCKNGAPVNCDPMEGSQAEVCDKLDNDCDGKADEDLPPPCNTCETPGLTQACSTDTGECTAGTTTCGPDKTWGKCSGIEAVAEKCDNLDNDCNGVMDDGNPEGGKECGDNIGICTKGQEICKNGKLECSGKKAEDEFCDLLDNDCDSKTDEGMPLDEYDLKAQNDTCSATTDMGQIKEGTEDNITVMTFSGNLYKDGGNDTDWYKILAKEASDWLPCGLSFDDGCYYFLVNLEEPEGVNYDLCIFGEDCEGKDFQDCAADGGPGEGETLVYGWHGLWALWLGNDDTYFHVQVKGASAQDQFCKPYTLTFEFFNACPVDGKCPWEGPPEE